MCTPHRTALRVIQDHECQQPSPVPGTGQLPKLLVSFLLERSEGRKPLLPPQVLPAHLGGKEKTHMGQQRMRTGWEQRQRRREEEIKKQNKNKQQRPSESPGGRRCMRPRDTAVSAHGLHGSIRHCQKPAGCKGGMEEQGPPALSPRAACDSAFQARL